MKKYAVVIEKGPRNFAAHVPDLPVILVSGKTVAQVTRRVERAIALYAEDCALHGRAMPAPTTRVKELAAA
ncbi:MAG: type II toxin-antitoxin system HicB family antitoxin [Vulcanimicrobiaceae bacterium]